MRPAFISWPQFNYRNSKLFSGQISLYGSERYRLCDIRNINQMLIAYKFLASQYYDFKEAKTVWLKTAQSR